jgi:hypothetical protein
MVATTAMITGVALKIFPNRDDGRSAFRSSGIVTFVGFMPVSIGFVVVLPGRKALEQALPPERSTELGRAVSAGGESV